MPRSQTNTDRVERFLSQMALRGGATPHEIIDATGVIGYRQEISRLRKRGHVIEARERRVNGKRVTHFVWVSGPSEGGEGQAGWRDRLTSLSDESKDSAIGEPGQEVGLSTPLALSEDSDSLFELPERKETHSAITGKPIKRGAA